MKTTLAAHKRTDSAEEKEMFPRLHLEAQDSGRVTRQMEALEWGRCLREFSGAARR